MNTKCSLIAGSNDFPHCLRRSNESLDEKYCNMETGTWHIAGPFGAASRKLERIWHIVHTTSYGVI